MGYVIGGIVAAALALVAVVTVVALVSDEPLCPEGQSYQVVAWTNQLVGKVNTVQPVYACK